MADRKPLNPLIALEDLKKIVAEIVPPVLPKSKRPKQKHRPKAENH